jgi:holin-like protein
MIKQCVIIFGCLAIGELIVSLTGLKLPSSIIGMILLTVSLKAGWIKLQSVKGISDLLSKNLAFFFVPSGVAIMLYLKVIQASFWPIVISALGSTVIVLMITGWIHQLLRKKTVHKVSTTITNDINL